MEYTVESISKSFGIEAWTKEQLMEAVSLFEESFIFPLFKDDFLFESNIQRTIPAEVARLELLKTFKVKPELVKVVEAYNGINIVAFLPYSKRKSKFLNKFMLSLGWRFSESHIIDYESTEWHIATYDPLFSYDKGNIIAENDFLYHWTLLYNVEGILKNGLLPKSENSEYSYEKKVHLLTDNATTKQLYQLGKELCDANKSPQNNGEYALLQICVNKLPEGMIFDWDPRCANGVCTKQTIPPIAIRIIEQRNFASE